MNQHGEHRDNVWRKFCAALAECGDVLARPAIRHNTER